MYKFKSITCDDFPYQEAKELFNEYSEIFQKFNINVFENLIHIAQHFLFAVYVKDVFEGVVFLTDWTNDSCELSGFSKRGNALNTKQAIQIICAFIFNNYPVSHIYSKTYERAAKICLLKSGFKHYKDNLYKLNKQ